MNASSLPREILIERAVVAIRRVQKNRGLIIMADLVAVASISPWVPLELKHLALMFDRVAVLNAPLVVTRPDAQQIAIIGRTAEHEATYRERFKDVSWLHQAGIALEITQETLSAATLTDAIVAGRREFADAAARHLAQGPQVGELTTGGEITLSMLAWQENNTSLTLRQAAVAFRQQGLDAYSVLPESGVRDIDAAAAKSDLIEITLNALPYPSDRVAWDDIVEFRNDPSARESLLALRVWMTEMARAKYTVSEAQERLEFLLDEYRRFLRAHRLEGRTGAWGALVNAGTDAAEHAGNLRFGTAARALFSVRQHRANLLKAEAAAPGREVAFIQKALTVFGRGAIGKASNAIR